MGGQVPAQDMTGERLQLLAEAMVLVETPDRDKWPARKDVRGLIERLVHAAERCPRTSCAYCEHIARSEADAG